MHDPGWGPCAGPGGGEAGPLACLPDAVLAEAVIVAEDDDFAWRGGTDAEAILDLEGHGRGGGEAQERERVTSMNRIGAVLVSALGMFQTRSSCDGGGGWSVHWRNGGVMAWVIRRL